MSAPPTDPARRANFMRYALVRALVLAHTKDMRALNKLLGELDDADLARLDEAAMCVMGAARRAAYVRSET